MKVYNSLTFKKEEFKTITPQEVKMYVCGITAYDSAHLGHLKSAISFDVIHRYLKFKDFKVNIVKNFTDIDDKIINRSNELGIDFKELSEKYIEEYEKFMEIMNVEKETRNPRATEVIPFIINFIKELIKKGHAYERNGSVYFSVRSFPKYKTIFQNIKPEDLEDEEEDYLEDQDTIGEDKIDPRDFALWKKMKEGEPYWESPWGKGRPGWHIECSAMVLQYLGDTIDIHGGGQDLKFPHHRNEIAQSESYTGKPFANYFIHNGFVNVDNEKMSKSIGNFFLVSDLLKQYDPMVLRFFLISSHYRSSINYSLENLKQAEKNYNKLINIIKKINDLTTASKSSKELKKLISQIDKAESNIIRAMDDDFDTPVAIAEIMSLIRELNKAILEQKVEITEEFKDRFFKFIENIDLIFGFFPTLKKELKSGVMGTTDEKDKLVKDLIEIISDIRTQLRKRNIYDLSDKIREKLRELGINIEDPKI
ncbi:MAG: cysteine--tRNA ligase [Promethearchaeota archaeon]